MARGLFGEAKSVLHASNDMPCLALVEFERTRVLFEVGLMNPPGSLFDCTIAVYCRDGRLDLFLAAPLLFRQPTELKISTPSGVRIALGDDKVLSFHGNQINEVLNAYGLEVFDPNYSCFTTMCGGPHCSVFELEREP